MGRSDRQGKRAMSDHKVTRSEETYFIARVQHWADFFYLGDWRIEAYTSTQVTENSAECEIWHNAHGAHILLRKTFDRGAPSKAFLNQLALHEVCHVLLCDLKRLIADRCFTDAQAETAEHAVIRRLEKVLLKRSE